MAITDSFRAGVEKQCGMTPKDIGNYIEKHGDDTFRNLVDGLPDTSMHDVNDAFRAGNSYEGLDSSNLSDAKKILRIYDKARETDRWSPVPHVVVEVKLTLAEI